MAATDGKYFEEIALELKTARAMENIEINQQFQQKLRAEILNKAQLGNGFDIETFFAKWKYLFTAVPAFAVLMLVAVGFMNWKVWFKNDQLVPVQNKDLTTNALTNTDNSTKNEVMERDAYIKASLANLSKKNPSVQNVDVNNNFNGESSDNTVTKNLPVETSAPTIDVLPKNNSVVVPKVEVKVPDLSIYKFDENAYQAPNNAGSSILNTSDRNNKNFENSDIQNTTTKKIEVTNPTNIVDNGVPRPEQSGQIIQTNEPTVEPVPVINNNLNTANQIVVPEVDNSQLNNISATNVQKDSNFDNSNFSLLAPSQKKVDTNVSPIIPTVTNLDFTQLQQLSTPVMTFDNAVLNDQEKVLVVNTIGTEVSNRNLVLNPKRRLTVETENARGKINIKVNLLEDGKLIKVYYLEKSSDKFVIVSEVSR